MKNIKLKKVALLSVLLSTSAFATEWGEEYGKRLKTAEAVGPLTGEFFGEKVGLFNGSTSFTSPVVSLAGNNSLAVSVSYRMDIGDSESGSTGHWDLDIPRLTGVFAPDSANGYWAPANRCSAGTVPPSFNGFSANEFWSGNKLALPGGGGGSLLKKTTDTRLVLPSDGGTYLWVTKDFWAFSCLSTLSNSASYPGEGFLGRAPDGTKYYFDHLVVSDYPGISHLGAGPFQVQLLRKRVHLYPSRVEDRFGNWVKYSWNAGKLVQILSSDGRQIDLTYSGTNVTITADDRQWVFAWPVANRLEVTNPDTSKWIFASTLNPWLFYSDNLDATGKVVMDRDVWCNTLRVLLPNDGTVTVTHPSGAVGTFNFRAMRHGRTNVPYLCKEPLDDQSWDSAWNRHTVRSDVYSLISKSVSGPGLTTRTWSYTYEGLEAGYGKYAPAPETPPPHYKYVSVKAPDQVVTTYTFGKDYGLNEGQLLGVTVKNSAGSVVRETINTYMSEADVASAAFPESMGGTLVLFSDLFSAASIRPQTSTTVTQDGRVFTTSQSSFDRFGRAGVITKSSAPAP